MTKHKRIKINMRQPILDSVMFSYFCNVAPTRSSVADECKVSKVTSGKVAKALVESGIMSEKTFSLNKESPCAHLFIDESVYTMVIDLSTPQFKLTLYDPNAVVKFESIYRYDSALLFKDNMNIFLSRCGLKAKRAGHTFSAIAVIYEDDIKRPYIESLATQVTLPSVSQSAEISDCIYEVFHKRPITHVTVSGAIAEALRFGASSALENRNGVSYIYIGSHLSSFHVHKNGSVTVCSPQNIISKENKDALSMQRFISKDDLDALFIELSNFMDSAFSPSAILLESEYLLPDDNTAIKLEHAFALKGITAPQIYFKGACEPMCILGLIRRTIYDLAKMYIKA